MGMAFLTSITADDNRYNRYDHYNRRQFTSDGAVDKETGQEPLGIRMLTIEMTLSRSRLVGVGWQTSSTVGGRGGGGRSGQGRVGDWAAARGSGERDEG